jgi:LmbE family N-acetylglucosaminyl deacetylase
MLKDILKTLLKPAFEWSFTLLQEVVRDGYIAVARDLEYRRVHRILADLDHVERIVGSNRYLSLARPEPKMHPDGDRILVLAPHQDDETIGPGGTLLRCVQRGKHLRIAYVTDGVARKNAVNSDPKIRETEARKIWSAYGVEDLSFWRLPCRNVRVDTASLTLLRRELDQFKPDTLFIPHFLEGPEDHRAVVKILLEVDRRQPLPDGLEIWSYPVTSILLPNVVVDVTELIQEKYRMNSLWQSQMTFFNYAHMAEGMAAYNSVYLPRKNIQTPAQLEKRRPQCLYGEVFFVAAMKDYRNTLQGFDGPADDGGKAPTPSPVLPIR